MVRLESSLSDEEKSKRDNERRKLARANALYFEKIHPSLVNMGLEGKFVLIDNKNVWGISGNRRELERCYNSVHREGGFDMFCYQIYKISAQEVKEQLERENAREKARKRERIRKKYSRKPREKEYQSGEKNKPQDKTIITNNVKQQKPENRKIYKVSLLNNSNKRQVKMGEDNKDSKNKGKVSRFRTLYKDYKEAREILEQGKRTGGLYFNNPDVYDKLLQKAQEIHKLFGRENATFERDVENGTEIDYLHNQDMWRIILAWYSGSREKLGKFLEKDDNLESIISGINPENLKEFISNTRPPKNITKEYEDLGNLHNLHKSYYDLSNLVRSYEEAGTNGQRGQISKISQAIKLSAIKIIEEKEKRIKDPEVKAFAGFFKRLASRSTSYALRDVVLPKLQNLKEEFDKELNDNDKKVRCYFEIMANEMKGEIGNSNDALFDILYALTQK